MFVFWWEMNGLTNQRLVLVCTFIVCEPCSKPWLVVFECFIYMGDYATELYGDYNRPLGHCKDPYQPTSIMKYI